MGVEGTHELVLAAADGDPAAFAALVGPSRSRVLRVVARLVGPNDAEDVLQETLLRSFLGLSGLRDATRFEGWLCGVAVNVAKMHLRRRASESRMLAAVAAGGEVANVPVEQDFVEMVRDALDVLPPGQRDVVLMHYIEELSCGEISQLTDISEGAVRVRLHRARQQLRRELAPLAPVPFAAEPKELPMVDVKVADVVVRVSSSDEPRVIAEAGAIVVLAERSGAGRSMPIFIGFAEAAALAMPLAGESFARPRMADLAVVLLRALGGSVEEVAITEHRERTFYAVVVVNGERVDARPSDAISLAVRAGAPIVVDETLLDRANLGDLTVAEKAELVGHDLGIELPPGEWRSLTAELISTFELEPSPGD